MAARGRLIVAPTTLLTPKLNYPVVGKGHALSAANRLRFAEIHLVEIFRVPLPCKGTGVGMPTPYEYISNNTASTAFSASLRLMAKEAPEAPL